MDESVNPALPRAVYEALALVRVVVSPSFSEKLEYAAFDLDNARLLLIRASGGAALLQGWEAPSVDDRPDAPAYECADRAVVDASVFRTVWAPLRAGVISAVPGSASTGLDGTTYEVIIGDRPTRAQYRWWEDAPTGWEPLGRFARDFIALIERSVGSPSSS